MSEGVQTTASDRLRWFYALIGLATIYHLINVGAAYRGSRVAGTDRVLTWVLLALGTLLALASARQWAAIALALVIPATIWRDAPVVGNHWIVMGLLSLAVLGALAATLLGRGDRSTGSVEEYLVPTARAVFFAFYGFSALAKVNRAFLEPSASCGTYFTDETARSLGWHLSTSSGGTTGRLVPIVVILIEFGVFLSLLSPRTRRAGILLAVVFHGLIAWDGYHSFHDFSATVFALLVLFVPEGFFAWYRSFVDRDRRLRVVARSAWVVAALSATLTIVIQSVTTDTAWRNFNRDFRNAQWRVISIVAVVVIVAYLLSTRGVAMSVEPSRQVPHRARWLALVPVLAIANGVSMYVGVKTSYSWNMYSNLVTVPGRANSYVVPSGAPFTSQLSDLVRITSSSDPALQAYADQDYSLPLVTLRAYTSTHPDTSLEYVRGGVLVSVPHTRADPILSRGVSAWSRRLFAYRAVDNGTPARCQPYFLPAS